MLLRLQKYTIHLAYYRGKEMFLVDILSKANLRNNDQTAVLNEETIHLARFLPVIEDRLQELRRETQMDETLMKYSYRMARYFSTCPNFPRAKLPNTRQYTMTFYSKERAFLFLRQ